VLEAEERLDGPAVMAKMKAMPINDFWTKGVQICADGQALRADVWKLLPENACPCATKG
jgi:hypothetical protein